MLEKVAFILGYREVMEKVAEIAEAPEAALEIDVPYIRKLLAKKMSTKTLMKELQRRGGHSTYNGKVFASLLRDRGFSDEEIVQVMKQAL